MNRPSYHRETRARSTGARVLTCTSREAGMTDDDGKWATVCLDHGGIVHHETLALARSWAAAPEGWCDDCRKLARRRALKWERVMAGWYRAEVDEGNYAVLREAFTGPERSRFPWQMMPPGRNVAYSAHRTLAAAKAAAGKHYQDTTDDD